MNFAPRYFHVEVLGAGELDKTLDESCVKRVVTVVSMKDDWTMIFPPPAK